MKKFFKYLDEKGIFGWNYKYLLTHPWKIIPEITRHIKYAWQRVFRGWDDTVPWSVDFYLAEEIPLWLDVLKKNKHGVPMMMFHDDDFDENDNWSTKRGIDELRRKEYEDILTEIQEGFYAYIRKCNYEKTNEEEDKKKFDRGMELFVKYFETFWD